MPLLDIQRKLAEHGRIRLGAKGDKGQPKKLETFRLTCASKDKLEVAARIYGGKVREWSDAPDKGYYELYTDATELNVLIPPIATLCSQYYETWSGGGCKRRCDGETELLSGEKCKCDPDDRECKVTTRISVMLPQIPGLGLWRLESHGWHAATTLPGTMDMLANQGKFVQAVLRLEQRSEKKDGKTRRFVVPVIDLPDVTVGDLLASNPALLLGGPASTPVGAKVARPELPEPASLPDENPEWNEGEGTDVYRQLIKSIGNVPAPRVDAWLEKWAGQIDKLDKTEQDKIMARANELRKLPF